MDSPLLPSLSRNIHNNDSSNLLADLSLEEDDLRRPSSSSHSRQQSLTDELPPRPASKSPHRPQKSRSRFSLFARPASPNSPARPAEEVDEGDEDDTVRFGRGADGDDGEGEYDAEEGDAEDDTIHGAAGGPPREIDPEREDKLRSTLFDLRRMNEVFSGFLGALEEVQEHNERLAKRTTQTTLLLDQYIALLAQAEHTQRLVLNERWTGAEDDAAHLHSLAVAAAEEAAALQARQEAARAAQEEKEREARERSERAASGAGVRGGGAGARGGIARGRGVGVARGRGASTATRTPAPTTTGTGTTGLRKPSAGYGGVRGSGYGPTSTRGK